MNHNDTDTLRKEYSAELIKSGERGKYFKQYQQGTNIVKIEPELFKLFPDTQSVNQALREFAKEHHLSTS